MEYKNVATHGTVQEFSAAIEEWRAQGFKVVPGTVALTCGKFGLSGFCIMGRKTKKTK